MSVQPTLYLGSAQVTLAEFNFGETVVTAPTPVNATDVTNKLYVDQLVQTQADKIDLILDGSTADLDQLKEFAAYVTQLSATD